MTSVTPEIDPVARPKVDPVFEHAAADRLDVRQVALLHPGDGARDLGARHRLQIREPFGEWLAPVRDHIVADFEHGRG